MKLGIIAGSGDLPALLAAHCLQKSIPFHVFAIEGQGFNATLGTPCSFFRLGAVGALVKLIKQQKITEIVFIGGIRKPSLLALWPDFFLLKQLPTLGLFRHGDDTLLRRIAERFERKLDVIVRGIHELMPQLLAPLGTIGAIQPEPTMMGALAIGIKGAQMHGMADKGQAVIAYVEGILAYEGQDGTAAMLRHFAQSQKKSVRGKAILVKLAKPQQDLRLDLPTIGPDTIEQAKAAGIVGIAVSAGKTLIVGQTQTVNMANQAGIFLLGLEA